MSHTTCNSCMTPQACLSANRCVRRKFAGIMRKRARYLMRKIHGEDAIRGKHIDHIDHNPLNNSIENLRIRDASENCADNTRKYKRIIERIEILGKKRKKG